MILDYSVESGIIVYAIFSIIAFKVSRYGSENTLCQYIGFCSGQVAILHNRPDVRVQSNLLVIDYLTNGWCPRRRYPLFN